MDDVIAGGQADMVGITRALMADPELLLKIKTGRIDRVRKCIAANECHYHDRAVGCAVNGRVGHERELKIEKATTVKKVLVVGGGPAGLEVARVTALRGHHVQLWERENVVGGTLGIIASDPARREFREYLAYLERQTADAGVEVVTGVEAIPDSIRELAPDTIVFATGSQDVRTFRGGTVPTMTATELYRATDFPNGRTLVVGALDDHLAPAMTAEFLADRGREVLLLTECHIVGQSLEAGVLNAVTRRLLEKSVTIMTLTELIGIDPIPRVRNIFNRREEPLEDIALVVFAGDRKANDALARAYQGLAAELYLIGDCLAPRRLVHATLDAVRIGVRV
jgi:NADPH-dependent 2,4-dienoyl-CoA reductase/sulfur reductase-like enzyme